MLSCEKSSEDTRIFDYSIYDFFEGEENVAFVEKMISLQKCEFSETDCLKWVSDVLGEVNLLIRENDLCEKFENAPNDLTCALVFCYISHWSYKRKSGESYLVHLKGVLFNVIESIINEKKLRDKTLLSDSKIVNTQKFIRTGIKAVLHDVVEEVFQVLTIDHDDKKSMEVRDRTKLLESQLAFSKELEKMLHLIFGSDVADSLMHVFTNFSERPLTAYSIEKGETGALNKEDLGRIDFLISTLSLVQEEDVDIKSADKKHNLKTKEKMKETKMLEIYNFIYLLYAMRKRANGKSLLDNSLYYYLGERGNKVKEKFYFLLNQKEKYDENVFRSQKGTLLKDLNDLYGEEKYSLRYVKLGAAKIHEMVVNEYYKQNTDKDRFSEKHDAMGHVFVTEEILDDPIFKTIFNNALTGRVVVEVNDDVDFHRIRAENLQFANFVITSRKDFYGEEGNRSLRASEYMADSLIVTPKVANDSLGNLKANNGLINLKLLTYSDSYHNEYGDNSCFNRLGNVPPSNKIFYNMLKNVRNILGRENYNVLKIVLNEICGVNLMMEVGDLTDVNNISKATQRKKIWEILKSCSDKVKTGLFLGPLLETGYANFSNKP